MIMSYVALHDTSGVLWAKWVFAIVSGVAASVILVVVEKFFQRFSSLRFFNMSLLGLVVGYCMGSLLVAFYKMAFTLVGAVILPGVEEIVRMVLFLVGTYTGLMVTMRSANEVAVSIPFVRFVSQGSEGFKVVPDLSALQDPRLIDLVSSRLLDGRLIVPKFSLRELHRLANHPDLEKKEKGQQGVDIVHELQERGFLKLQIVDTNFPQIPDLEGQFLQFVRLHEAHVLSSDPEPLRLAGGQDLTIVSMNQLAQALQPLMSPQTALQVKIMHRGNVPEQGVGYLPDGAMVVINNAGDDVGYKVEGVILSVKHTKAGRIVFCNRQDRVDD